MIIYEALSIFSKAVKDMSGFLATKLISRQQTVVAFILPKLMAKPT